MNYRQTVDYLFRCLPMYHRVGPPAYKADLKNILALSEAMGNPERNFRSIHIAGTNGKGSVSHMLASIFQEAGYKTGLFTSPHLKDYRERVKINGKMISEEKVVEFVSRFLPAFEQVQPSFFEWTTALAFHHFAAEKVDVAVIETGLGGRLDSTNIIKPAVSVITNISFDHMQHLGDTLEKIASEKAGIIKPGTPVIIGERQPATENVFTQTSNQQNTSITFASDRYHAEIVNAWHGCQALRVSKKGENSIDYILGLSGNYQAKNICTVLAAMDELIDDFPLAGQNAIVHGLENVTNNTGLRGRWETLGTRPAIIADVGHNPGGIQYVVDQLAGLTYKDLHMVIGVVNDKDAGAVLALLPKNATYYFCRADIPRALDEHTLMHKAHVYGLKGRAFSTVEAALKAAKSSAETDDLIFVGGSTFVVAEVI